MLESNEKILVDQWKYTIAQSPLMGQVVFQWGSPMEALWARVGVCQGIQWCDGREAI